MFGICVFNKKLSGMGEGLSEDNRWEKSNFFFLIPWSMTNHGEEEDYYSFRGGLEEDI